MQQISVFTLKGQDIEVMYRNGNIAYVFERDGKTYGHKVELKSRSITNVMSVTFLLLQNALDTLETLQSNAN